MNAEARLVQWGGYAALAAVAVMVVNVGLLLVGTGGEFGDSRRDTSALAHLADNQSAMALFAWLWVLYIALLIPAVLGFHAALRATKLPLVIGTASATIGLVFGLMYWLLTLGVIYDVAPGYAAAGAASQPAIEVVGRGMLTATIAIDSLANVFFGIGVGLFSLAILETRAVPRWLGWFGLALAVAGVLDGPAHWFDPLILVEVVGAVLAVIWFVGMGISMLRVRVPAAGGAGA